MTVKSTLNLTWLKQSYSTPCRHLKYFFFTLFPKSAAWTCASATKRQLQASQFRRQHWTLPPHGLSKNQGRDTLRHWLGHANTSSWNAWLPITRAGNSLSCTDLCCLARAGSNSSLLWNYCLHESAYLKQCYLSLKKSHCIVALFKKWSTESWQLNVLCINFTVTPPQSKKPPRPIWDL